MSHDPLAGMPGDVEADEHAAQPAAESGQQAGPADSETGQSFALPENLTIADVDDARSGLLPLLSNGSPLQISASDVESIDAAGLQLLASLAKTAQEAALTLSWVEPSSTLKQAASDLGLSDVLGLDKDVVEEET